MADAATQFVVNPLPEYERRASTTGATQGTDTATKPVTPREEAAQTELAKQTEEEKALVTRKGAQAGRAAEVEKQNVDAALFVEEGLNQLRTGPDVQSAQQYIDIARGRLREQQDKLDKMPPPALFADRDGWGKVRLGVGMALAGLGDGMMAAAMIRAGHAPSGRSTTSDIIERDLERQRAAIGKQKDSIVQARTGLDDAQEARRMLLADIELKGKAMYRQVELLTRQRLAGLKMDQASIDQTKEILDLQRAQREQEAAFAGHHGTTVTKRYDSPKTTTEVINRSPTAGKGGGGVEADKNSANYNLFKEHGGWLADNGAQLTPEDRNQILGITKSAGFLENVKAGAAWLGVDQERGLSPRAKEYLGHMREAADGYGRIKSGGAINHDEEARFVDQFIIKPSDTPTDVKNRADIVRQNIRIMGPLDKGNTPAAPGEAVKPDAVIPPPAKDVPFTRAGVMKMKAIAKDSARTRRERDDATAYVRAAHAEGVD